jgi:hypothetical protein
MTTVRMLDAKKVVQKFNIVELCFTESYAMNGSLKCVSTCLCAHFIYRKITKKRIAIKTSK